MSSTSPITNVEFTVAPSHEAQHGLLGFVRFRVGGLLVDGVAVRTSSTGTLVLSFPRRKNRSGRTHDLIRPVNQSARDHITTAVLAAIDLSMITKRGGAR